MAATNDPSESALESPREFATTHWSIVLLAGGAASPGADQALEHLCQSYWYPLYAYVRRQGHTSTDAQDLTQDFFARFLQREYFKLADPNRGRFRTFLLSSLKHFLTNQWRKEQAAKRGGGQNVLSWDEQTAEGRYLAEDVSGFTPESIYEKRWAVTLLEKVLGQLRARCVANGKAAMFDALKPSLLGDTMIEGYDAIATRLGSTPGAVRVAMHRFREEYRELLRDEVARTVASPADVDAELRALVAALRN